MKLSPVVIVLSVLAECQAYMAAPQRSLSSPSFSVLLRSSATSNDAAFSAFADSLEVIPEVTKEKKATWQSKLDDLLNPSTNPAEKQILLSELLSSNEQIRESVMDALSSRKVRPIPGLLWTSVISQFTMHVFENVSKFCVDFFLVRRLLDRSPLDTYSSQIAGWYQGSRPTNRE